VSGHVRASAAHEVEELQKSDSQHKYLDPNAPEGTHGETRVHMALLNGLKGNWYNQLKGWIVAIKGLIQLEEHLTQKTAHISEHYEHGPGGPPGAPPRGFPGGSPGDPPGGSDGLPGDQDLQDAQNLRGQQQGGFPGGPDANFRGPQDNGEGGEGGGKP